MKPHSFKKTLLATSIALVIAGCSTSDDSDDNNPGQNNPTNTGSMTPEFEQRTIASSDTSKCPAGNGGHEIDQFLDKNDNGSLDTGELIETFILCNGEDGAPGQAGMTGNQGQDGQDGVSPTVMVSMADSLQCPDGGSIVSITDANGSYDVPLCNPSMVDDMDKADMGANNLKRVMSAPLGAEFTGMFLNTDGRLFANIQHPSTSNTEMDADGKTFDLGTVGVVDENFNKLAATKVFAELPLAQGSDKELVLSAVGEYKVLTQQGDTLDDGNKMGDIVAADGTTVIKNSNDPDFNAAVPSGDGGYYLYTNWEDRPGSMSRIKVSDDYVTVTKEGMLDFSDVDGTWVNCFGTLSPWGTPMSAEELYFDNTADWFDSTAPYFSNAEAIAEYKGYPLDRTGNWGNPYDYGYIVEIGTENTVATANIDDVEVNKLELMGRFSHENSVTMPDQKTTFLSDDGTGTVLFKFVSDTAGQTDSGKLYAAKATQQGGMHPTQAYFEIEWIEIASGTESEIETAITEFDGTFAEAKYITDEQINEYAEYKSNTDLDESGSIATNPYSDERVGFLESRKVAKAMGATAEFRKMEGININYDLASAWWNDGRADGTQAHMFLAMSSFDSTMADGEGDIQLDGTDGKCGVVYGMELVQRSTETDSYVDIEMMMPLVVGGPYNAEDSANRCHPDNISNPDNLLVLDDGRVLIGEDTGNHENNAIWLFSHKSNKNISLTQVGRYSSGVFDESAAEIVSYDPVNQQIYVVNSNSGHIDVLDFNTDETVDLRTVVDDPTLSTSLDVAVDTGLTDGAANSVDVKNGLVAVAIGAATKTDNGKVAFYKASDNSFIAAVDVGALPDMLTFTPDGSQLVVAIEGEPSDDNYAVDPNGEIAIIDIDWNGVTLNTTLTELDFSNIDEVDYEVVTNGYQATFAQDMEPEYVAIDANGMYAYVALQENNAVAQVDLVNKQITGIQAMGFKDHMKYGNGFDGNNKDEMVLIKQEPALGMYQPDSIATMEYKGTTFLLTANEGDDRSDWLLELSEEECESNGFYINREDDECIDDITLKDAFDSDVYDPADHSAKLKLSAFKLGGINQDAVNRVKFSHSATMQYGDTDNDGYIDRLLTFGGRSFSIWNTDMGEMIYDSGDDFERITAMRYGADFNQDNAEQGGEDRSDNKGPEPEALTVGMVGDRTYAFIGMERMGGIMVYDVTNPYYPRFVQYVNNRDMTLDPADNDDSIYSVDAGDLGPEGFEFVSADVSPTGQALLIVGNEVSGTTTIYEIVE